MNVSALPEKELRRLLNGFGVPARYQSATRPDFAPAFWAKAGPFLRGHSLFVCGGPGRGKTHLAAALLKELARLNPAPALARFVGAALMLAEIRSAFSTGGSELELIKKFGYANCLVIDDLGLEKPSEWVRQTLTAIIDCRYGDRRQTLVTSNLTLDQLSGQLGDRLSSRLAEMCVGLSLDGPDRRAGRAA